jgi:TRAP-type uncharacterized transport system fused permease subunit
MVIEAARRSTGWIMPIVIGIFIVYAFAGPWLPDPWSHRGYDVDRLVGHMYMTLEGIFGVAVDVSATLIILFTIYGAFLQYSGAGKFFLDFSFALFGGKTPSSGRAVVLRLVPAGRPSGSGVATTVTIGTWRIRCSQRAGYEKNAAGGLLAAGGLGAILSPPVLGAPAFLIAEFLKISYLEVIKMALVPTVLLLLLALPDGRAGRAQVRHEQGGLPGGRERLDARQALLVPLPLAHLHRGVHADRLFATVSVFWATVTAFIVSFFRRETAMRPERFVKAMEEERSAC